MQSSTVLLKMCHGELEPVDHAIFADTGWEPQEVYDWLDEVLEPGAEAAGIGLHRVKEGDLRLDALSESHRFASMPLHVEHPEREGQATMIRRQCTREYKIAPVRRKIRELLGDGWRAKRVRMSFGISADEAVRMKGSRVGYIDHHYPLIFDQRMTRHDCVRWLEKHGYDSPPRSACIGCPFHSNAEWRRIRDEHPDQWQDAVDFDRAVREDGKHPNLDGDPYLHRQLVPLDQVDLRTPEDRGQTNLFGNECEGMCGV